MKPKLISKILGVGLAIGLVLSLGAAFIAPPAAQADQMEWSPVNTPSWDDLVILPASDIMDYAVGGDEGDIIYAVLRLYSDCTAVGWEIDPDDDPPVWGELALVKSDDGGVSWSDITENVVDASSLPNIPPIHSLNLVAVAPDDHNWVAVAGYFDGLIPFVVASQDGGDNFTYAHDLVDSDNGREMQTILDMAVSPKVGNIHNIALAGINDGSDGTVFRLEAGTWLTGEWQDTSFYEGWDDVVSGYSVGVVAVEFSPNFDMDDTVVCMSVDKDDHPYLQEGIFNSGGAWNGEAGFGDAVQIINDGNELLTEPDIRSMGFALPADFDGSDSSTNNVYLYVNAYDSVDKKVGGYVMISEDGALSMRCGPSADPILASIDVHGDADTCKAMVGVYADWDDDSMIPLPAEPCSGVAVYHTVELDDCCPEWECACKDPSGPYMAVVSYTPDGQKAYATTTGSWRWQNIDNVTPPFGWTGLGNALDESAFSVSLDDAVSFNQIGLIDTDIDFFSDVAVCPDCSVIYLSTINMEVPGQTYDFYHGAYPCGDDCDEVDNGEGWFACDSIWRSYDNGDTWERVYHGDWTDDPDSGNILLRLPCDEDTECCTIYMGIQGTRDLFYSRGCGQCWNKAVNQKLTIQDFAVETENIVYILDQDGYVSTSTQYGRRPSDGVDTGVGSGHTIVSCCNEGFVVVGGHGDELVAWSDDGGETWNTTDDLPGDGGALVHVARDPVCENIIYAALGSDLDTGAIYRTDITDGSWDNINAAKFPYHGVVVAREGTLYAVSYAIGVDSSKSLCEEGRFTTSGDEDYSGVARNLTPCETDCCGTEDWDYLIAGLAPHEYFDSSGEWFDNEPSALRICGCLTSDTNSVLWAIDTQCYDVTDGSGDNDCCGGLWSYEDCAAKHGPELTSPEDGAVLSCDVCDTCAGAAFTLKWERMCLACSYDIEIMDEDGNTFAYIEDIEITGDPPTLYIGDTSSFKYSGQDIIYSMIQIWELPCGRTYTWHVREANTETDECVHSPWSETWSFTIEASSANAVRLIAPEQGAVFAQRTGVGFSWSSVYDANKYSFVLSGNPNLSGALATAEVTGTAYAYSGTLDYEATYYWQVTAWKGSTMMSQSDIGTFAIASEEYIPPEPQPTPPPVVNIPPTQQITPTWIYAMIGIGAVLIVVVIVLIVRSRRPS